MTAHTTSSARCDGVTLALSNDLGVIINVLPGTWCKYLGTRGQLEGDGLTPEGLDWPDAFAPATWTAGGLSFDLRRRRPDGAKGVKSQWAEVDYWCLSVDVPGRGLEWSLRNSLERRAADLRRDRLRLTPAGQLEAVNEQRREHAARRDAAFQAFKRLVPGLTPEKRSRASLTNAGSNA